MPTQGRLLEVLAASLEKLLAPHGVIVKSPEFFYEEINGKKRKIGEVDITLRTASTLIGIECRDRPRQGTEWLTQIDGKRKLLQLYSMTAVSTTGFTEEAVYAAEKLNIGLMTLKEISPESLGNWIRPAGFEFSLVDYKFLPNVSIVSKDRTLLNSQVEIDLHKPIIKLTHLPQCLSIQQYLEIHPDVEKELNKFNEDSITADKIVSIIGKGNMRLFLPKRKIEIEEIQIPIQIFRESVTADVLMQTYINFFTGLPKAVVGTARLPLANGEIKAIITQKRASDGKSIEQRIDYVGERYEPLSFMRIESKLIKADTNEVFVIPNP